MAATREQAHTAFATFVQTYEPKYPKAAECLAKDKTALLAFYDFPAAHWMNLRTTNPIESTFATVRLRTAKTRGCVSRGNILSMVFKLVKCAEGRWRALRGSEMIVKVITGVQFKDGIEMRNQGRQKVAACSPRRTQHLSAPGQAWAIGRGGKEAALKLCKGTQWVRTPPGKG